MSDSISTFYHKPILVLGCGNVLFGDDGFGPAVIEYVEKNYKIPEDVCIIDVGTGIRKILFNVAISEEKPRKIIIVDAVDTGRVPGDVFEIPIEDMPENKIDDFSMHQPPTLNLLKELQDTCGVEVSVISCQVGYIPKMVKVGLSEAVASSIAKASEMVMKKIFES